MKGRTLSFLLILSSLCIRTTQAAPLDSLAKALSKGASSLNEKRVAVLAFPYHDGKISSGSSVISERLTTLLVGKKNIRVVERRLIGPLLSEKKLSETGVIGPDDLKAIGSVLGVDAIVTGTLIDTDNNRTEINARMIKIDSGEVIAAGQETIERSWSDSPVTIYRIPTRKIGKKETTPLPSQIPAVELMAPVANPVPSSKPPLKLSNESFPPERRRYLANEKPGPKKTTMNQAEKEREELYESAFDEGYREAQLEKLQQKKEVKKEPIKEPVKETPTLQHPGKIGTVKQERVLYH